LYFIHQFLDEGKGVSIGDGEGIEFSVVNDWPRFPILFPNEEEWGGVLRLQWTNVSLFQILLDVIFKFSLFDEGEGICYDYAQKTLDSAVMTTQTKE
jgi:hypothetical protein